MAKFQKILVASNEQIKQERANLIISSTKREAEAIIDGYKRQLLKISDALIKKADIAPKDSTSLTFGGDSGEKESAKWIEEMLALKQEEFAVKQYLKIAEDFYNEWFVDESPLNETF